MKGNILVLMIFLFAGVCFPATITLKSSNLDECIGITSFLSNSKGEIFLFSMRTHKVFKFKKNGDFEKSFCRYGVGPGEIKRVLFMFHNPVNDFLYLPEISSGVGRVSIFDSNGNFKDYLEVELAPRQKDHIYKLIFLEDGSFYTLLSERVDWEPKGKIYMAKYKLSVLYFGKNGKLKSPIYTTFQNKEVADRPRMGGPQVLFLPSILIKKTPVGNICIGKTDENLLYIYDKCGSKRDSVELEIKRLLLSDDEFQKTKSELVKAFKEGSRMQWLAKHMIKLKYKPIFYNFFVFQDYYVLVDIKRDGLLEYPEETTLIFFDKKGKRKTSKKINGNVMNILNTQLYIVEYDQEGNETFLVKDLDMENQEKVECFRKED
ncbi:MAG: hypothetical protein GTO45_02915 [Candidatus Aminicenantes bacterium]|nr:hypothetical protein [Candidatus Aminicenantes bacterium]NIM77677.1 hypothetical protein [Candidatus Aminicenantes bacterium]NIN16990.1 hypothetical protein [Candidatus Aminicenantes bacterium]NIN40883.1 hypothetical protein [Candidatus Aminicenantes bacterium]NIN83688.1 hypothetical protein [Candidatus Aminicenantes bacterium]